MKKKIKLYKGIFLIKKKYNKKQFYYYLKVPNVAVMVPVLNKKFLLVFQKREPINSFNYEFPCGWIDKGEAPSKSAARELLEETGYKSLAGPKKLITFFEEPGRLSSKAICFYTTKLFKINIPEKGINIIFCSKRKVIELIKKKKI